MPTDDEGTRVTRATRKRLGSIDIDPAPSPSTPKKTAAARKGADQLPAIAESDAKNPENVPKINGTPKVTRTRKSVSESVDTPTTGTNSSTPLTGLRRKPGEVSEPASTPGRRVTRRTSNTETFEELHLPVRRVTRRTSNASEDAGHTASPALATRGKQRMSIVVAPTDATLIEEAEEPLNERSDSPAENTRSRVRALSHSPYNSGTDSKNTSAKESDVTAALAQDLKVNLEEAFNDEGPVAAKSVSFDKDTAGNEADDDKTSKTKFAKTPKTVKNLSYTGNSTVEVSKMMNSTSENDMSQKGDSSVATEDLDKSLEQLAQDIQNKGLPIAEESIMSSVQSPKVGKKDVCPVTPGPTASKLQSISSSTPIVKATPAPGSPKKAVTPLVGKVVEEATPKEEKKVATPKKRELNATFAGKSSPKKQVVANRSWSHSVHGSSDKKIDAFGSTPDSPAKPVTVAEDKKAKRKSIPRVVSSDEEDDDNSSNFEDDECEEAPDDYQSGDSMNESEREEMEDNEIVDDGESVDSDDSAGAADADFDEYERNSFLATDEEVDDEELLDGTGDDLSLASESKTSPKKRNSRKFPTSDVSMDSDDSCDAQKKTPKKGGRIVRNPVDDSSSEDDEAQTEELNDNELEIVQRFQNTVSELASKLKSPGTTPKKPEESSRKSIKAPEEEVPESSKKTRKSSLSQAEPKAVEEEADKPEQTSEETTADQTQKTRKSSTTQDDRTEKEKVSPKKQTKPVEEEKDESEAITKSPRKSLKGPGEDVSKSAKKSRKSSVGQTENENNQATSGEEHAKSPRKSLKQAEDKSPKKASNTEENTDSQNNAKSPPKSAKKPEKADHEQDEQDSEDAASDEEDSDGEEEENGDESGSGEETSDDDYDDIVEDMEDIEDSDEEPKKKKKQTNTNKIDEKPTNMFGIKEQRLHVLLQKCHEYVGTKKDELEEKKKLTKGAREAKRQERLKRREEEAARKQAQEAEEGRTVIKKKKKRKPKQKNPELGDDESNANKELPAIVKKKMEILEKRRQRNREKKAARKKKQMGTDTTQSSSSNAEVSPTKKAATSPKSEKKAKKKDKQANDTSLQLQNLPTHISMAALNMQLKAAAKAEEEAKNAEKQLENPVKVDAPKLIEDTSNAPVPKKKKHQDNQEIVTKPIQTEAEDTSSSSVPKKKKRQILDIVEQTLKQDKQEQSSAKPPPPKKRLNILDESGAFSTAQFDVVPVTPEAKLLKQNSGFKEAPITPEPINFKVTSIIPKHQPAPTKSKGGFKEAMRKKLANIQEVDHKMPLPKWKLKPTSSGEFVVTKTKREAGDFIPLSTEGSTTQFAVATLDSMPATNGGGNKKRKSGNAAPVAASNAQKFKENAIMGTAQRESMKAKFRKIDKKKANRAGFSF